MSAESELASMLSHVSSNISSLSSSAESMVIDAISTLESEVEFPDPPIKIDAAGLETPWLDLPSLDSREIPLSFPAWPEIDFEEPPALESPGIVVTLGGAGSEMSPVLPDFPDLTLPDFDYPSLARVGTFSKAVPVVSTEITLPDLPDLNPPSSPTWVALNSITLPNLSVATPAFASIDTTLDIDSDAYAASLTQFNDAIFNGAEGVPGLDGLLTELSQWMEGVLEALTPSVLSIMESRFTDVRASILGFHEDVQARLTVRLQDEYQRVATQIATARSGWDLPALVQNALTATVQQVSQSWVQQAESQVETKLDELKMGFFEFCGELYESLQKAIVAAKVKEIEYVLEAHRLSIAYAKQSVKGLLKMYDLETFTQQNFYFKKAEAQLQLFEAELKIAMVRYELAKAQLSVEKAQQDYDALAIKQYQIESEAAGLDVQLYASQVSAARTELALLKLPFEVFEAQVKAFDAQIDGHLALVNGRIAELEGDSAKVEGEKAKLNAFIAEVRGFEKVIQVKRETINTQINRNEAVIAQYEAEIRAFFAPIEQSLLQNEYELKKYTVLAEDYLADARWAAEAAQVELEFLQREQEGLMTAFQETQDRGRELMEFELKRLDAIAGVNAKGAAILADMAGGAMSAANGLANVIFSEEA
jgi:hypothetical protein